jgi:hypothetical protein
VELERLADACRGPDEVFRGPAQHAQLAFGPRWDNVRRVRWGDREALVTLELPTAYVGDLERFVLHPALMDMATGGAQALIEGFDPATDFYVPISFGRLRARGRLAPKLVSHIRYRGAPQGQRDFAVFDVTIYDERGVELVDIEEFTMKRIGDRALLGSGEGPAVVHHVAHHPAPNPVLEVLEEAIRPSEGVEALERIVAWRAGPQVVVSPFELDTWIAKLVRAAEPAPPASDEAALPDESYPETEAALLEHPAVQAAAVASRGRVNDRKVVAFVVHRPGAQATVSELRRFLRERVPDAQVPAAIVELEALPETPEGELDRRALPDPFGGEEEFVPPSSVVGKLLADMWRELLGVDRVGAHDNFFDIGGHSLLAIRLITRIHKRLGVRLQHADVVVNTLEQLAAKCVQAAPEAVAQLTGSS